ncbi:MAG: hypothetical protein K2P51_03025 [Rhabdochlamydiaceae bacterium]|nr:hypothetical protein [Rhabdochlamydiaceae bacterium]
MAATSSYIGPYLETCYRPASVQAACDAAFETVKKKSAWGVYNGSDHYLTLGGIKDHELVGALIMRMTLEQPSQKEFNIVDIGAGGFQWGKALASYINTVVQPKIQVNIYNVRGESLKQLVYKEAEKTLDELAQPIDEDDEESLSRDLDRICSLLTKFSSKPSETQSFEDGVCHIHNLGAFKVENIGVEFAKRGIDLRENLHFAISHMCMLHLVDPLGTFADIANLLAPNYGHAWIDGFSFNIEIFDRKKKGERTEAKNEHLMQLMKETNLAFLRMKTLSSHNGAFLVRRKDESPTQLRMHYVGVDEAPSQIGASKKLIHFLKADPIPTASYSFSGEIKECDFASICHEKHVFIGDRELFSFLKEKDLFFNAFKKEPVLVEIS